MTPTTVEGTEGMIPKRAWIRSTLGELCRTTTGGTPSRTRPDYFGGEIPWVKSGELTDGHVSEVEEFITDEALAKSNAKIFPTGTLLIALYGATVGKLGLLKRAAATNQAVCAIFPQPEVETKFLFWYLRYRRADLIAQAVGGAQPNISQSILRSLDLPVPPLDDQSRIVAEIEKQFSRLDEAVANLKRVKANLKRYKAAVLKAAVEGRLVPIEAELARREGRSYETGAQLLQRILETRRNKRTGEAKYAEPQVVNTSDLPLLPDGWAWVPFAHLGADPFNTVQTGPFGAQLHNTEFTLEGVPVIAVGNLTGTGFSGKGLYFISAAKAKQLARYDVWAGDLLFARSGATLGKVCVAPPEVKDWRMTGHILRARLNGQFIKPEVAVYSLAALPAVRRQVFGNVRGVTRPGFNTTLLESIVIPIPPLSEQQRIVDEVDRRLSFVNEVEGEVDANLERAQALRQSVMQRAFKPNDATRVIGLAASDRSARGE